MNEIVEIMTDGKAFYCEGDIHDILPGWYYLDGSGSQVGPYNTQQEAAIAMKQDRENV